jgi:hypothetical protein
VVLVVVLVLKEAVQAHLVLVGRVIKAAITLTVRYPKVPTRRLLAVVGALEPLEGMVSRALILVVLVLAVRVHLTVLLVLQ